MKKLVLPVVLCFCSIILSAQYYQTGEDPASLKWRQINTDNFQVIYPDYFEDKAQRLTSVLEEVYKFGGYSLGNSPKKISIILHTQTVQSNGLVAWAPKRSEFYTTPHQDIYPQDWLEELSIHEFRHIVQLNKVNSGLPGIVKAIFGEQVTALVFGAYLPWWFIEGDAVATETALSKYGRGRFPSFLMEHKAQVVEKGLYSYDKAYNGSYKDYVPNFYRLGYYLVGNSRLKYGTELWESAVENVGKRFYGLSPFNSTLKELTGKNKVQLYHSVFDSLKNVWLAQDEKYNPAPYQKISKANKRYTSYEYNYWLNDSTIISYKSAQDKIGRFVAIGKNGKEDNLCFPGTIFSESATCRDKLLVWSEQIPDARWAHSGKSLIRTLDAISKKTGKFYPEFKCCSPSISPDKSSIAVVETNFANDYFLSVYSLPEGKLTHRFQTGDNNYFFSPEWIGQHEIALVLLTEDGKRLAKLDLNTDKLEILVDRDLGETKQLRSSQGKLYFISSYSGKNGLYSYDLTDESLELVYEPRFGAAYPDISNSGEILLGNYTSGGFELIKLVGTKPVPIDSVKKGKYHLADGLAKQEKGIPVFNAPDTLYQSKKYNKTAHLFNFHSWAPVYVDADSYEFTPGASLMSQNKLGTATTVLGYKWDVTEETGQFYGNCSYNGWYPVFSLEASTGNKASNYYYVEQTKNQLGEIIKQDTVIKRFTWKRTNIGLGMKLPFDLSSGAFYRFVQPEVQYEYTKYKHNPSTPESYFQGAFQSFSYRLYCYQLLRQSSMDVYPDFGIVLDGSYQHSPLGNTDLGDQKALQSILYLPGLLKNHGVKIYSGVQNKNYGNDFSFSDILKYPRGMGSISSTQMFSLGADYKLPLFYPEWSLGGAVYLQRVSASLFGDYANFKGNVYKNGEAVGTFAKDVSSFGLELKCDVNFLRFYSPANIGFRASYLPDLSDISFDFLFSVDFSSFY